MRETIISYFSAAASELPSLSQGLNRFRDGGGRAVISARTQSQLFDQARSRAFVSDALRPTWSLSLFTAAGHPARLSTGW